MKLPIKFNNKTYYLDDEEWKMMKSFTKELEIEFTRNVRKSWHSLKRLKNT
jgi:hypothetical protein